MLIYRAPLSQLVRQRLAVLRESSGEFEISRKDLELRGPGEVLGTHQTGMLQFRIADLMRDQALLGKVEQAALHLHRVSGRQYQPDCAALAGARAPL